MYDESTSLQRLREAYAASRTNDPEENPGALDAEKSIAHLYQKHVATGDELVPEAFPTLRNLSAAFIYQFLPIPKSHLRPEFVYVPSSLNRNGREDGEIRTSVFVTEWNMCWEVGHLRHQMFEHDVPKEFQRLREHSDENIFLLPRSTRHRYYSYAILFHMLPKRILDRHGLPYLKRGLWPHYLEDYWLDSLISDDFDRRLEDAFADLVWSRIDSGSGLAAFSRSDPLRILAHNLDFWLPYAHEAVEQRLRSMPRVEVESKEQQELLNERERAAPDGVYLERPRMGCQLWGGEQEALEATDDLVEKADGRGKLRGIIDAVRSNRVEDDFSDRWSFAKEDFERKLYSKRSKVSVTFVELDDTIPVHGPESEVHENLLWEDFMGLLSPKERRITVLLRKGYTRLGDIAAEMGYANHSPISKALAKIRRKAIQFLE